MTSKAHTIARAVPLAAFILVFATHCGEPMILSGDTGVTVDSPTGVAVDSGAGDTGVVTAPDVPNVDIPNVDVPNADVPNADVPNADVPTVDACVPQCNARSCGDDRCGGVCGVCDQGSMCNAQGICMGGSGMWTLIAAQGDVTPLSPDGSAWDVGINVEQRAPDPKVCVTLPGGAEQCSPFISNSIAPAWNFRFTRAVSTGALMAGVRMRYLDDDTLADDDICAPATVTVSNALIQTMRFEWRCASGGVTFRLEVR